jgi:hypothetical protein
MCKEVYYEHNVNIPYKAVFIYLQLQIEPLRKTLRLNVTYLT